MTTEPFAEQEQSARRDITDTLIAWSDGDEAALGDLMPLVLPELRKIAYHFFSRESGGHTLQPTALVNEVYIRLSSRREVQWRNREHFFGFAAQEVRRVLVDHARRRLARKRGDGAKKVPLSEVMHLGTQTDNQLVALDEALRSLAHIDKRQSRVVELRFFVGLTNTEVAEVLGVSEMTIKRLWRTARVWLHHEILGDTCE